MEEVALPGWVFPTDSDVQLECFVWGVGFCIWLPQKWLWSGSPPNREAQKAFISQCQHLQSFSEEVFVILPIWKLIVINLSSLYQKIAPANTDS